LTSAPSSLTCISFGDLEEFVATFARRNIIGGMKGIYHPDFFDNSNSIVHARYLLSIATEEQVETLMAGTDPLYSDMPIGYYPAIFRLAPQLGSPVC
jgi:hypothetical protein